MQSEHGHGNRWDIDLAGNRMTIGAILNNWDNSVLFHLRAKSLDSLLGEKKNK